MLGIITLLGFTLLALPIFHYQDTTLQRILSGGRSVWFQLFIGLSFGALSGMLAWGLISTHFMSALRWHYASLMSRLKMGFKDILFLSLCAGFGEELFFRAGLQSYMGIWLTSFVFVALHGYLNPLKPRLMLYGLFMVVVIAGFGKLYANFGIITSMSAHFAIDVILLTGLVFFPAYARHPITDNQKDLDYES